MKIIAPIEMTTGILTSNVAIDDYSEWASDTTYAEGDKVRVTSELGTWESLEGSNTGNDPMLTDNRVSETPKWLYLGMVNRWLMFDEYVGTQTENADSIEVEIDYDEILDTLTLQEVDAAQVQVVVNDPVEGVVYDETYELLDYSASDYYEYFFAPYEIQRNLTIMDLPPYSDATITITISETGATVKCGNCILGMQADIGYTQYGPRMGIIDYSKKQIDDFGRAFIKQGNFAKRATMDLWVENGSVDYVFKTLVGARSTPTVFVGDPRDGGFQALTIFGFYRDFEITIPGPAISTCTLEVEGFI